MRRSERLKLSYRAVFHYSGRLLLVLAIILLLPMITFLFSPEELYLAPPFLGAAVISLAIGGILTKYNQLKSGVGLTVEEGGILVVFTWTMAMILSALPFYWGGQLSWSHSIYEAVSGWTTTGLSVVDVEQIPRVFLLWRSIMQLGGGAGLAVMMLAAIIGPPGLGLYRAEGRSDQLLPNVRRSTSLILKIYFGYVVVGVVLYIVAGMPPFDAINHSFAALSTGGFSTRAASIGVYDSIEIEAVTVLLMLAGTTNFASHFVLLRGRVGTFFKQGETRLLAMLLLVGIPLLVVKTALPVYRELPSAVRHGIFEAVSALSTTGFSTASYQSWNDFGIMILVLMMLVGGGVGSTAGGMKQYRIFLMLKSVIWQLREHLLPQRSIRKDYVWRGEQKYYVDTSALKDAAFYIFVYLVTYFVGVMIFLSEGHSLRDSLFEFASALGTVGLSVGITGPHMSPLILWTEVVGMTLGRLEFFVVFFSVLKVFKDLAYVRKA